MNLLNKLLPPLLQPFTRINSLFQKLIKKGILFRCLFMLKLRRNIKLLLLHFLLPWILINWPQCLLIHKITHLKLSRNVIVCSFNLNSWLFEFPWLRYEFKNDHHCQPLNHILNFIKVNNRIANEIKDWRAFSISQGHQCRIDPPDYWQDLRGGELH